MIGINGIGGGVKLNGLSAEHDARSRAGNERPDARNTLQTLTNDSGSSPRVLHAPLALGSDLAEGRIAIQRRLGEGALGVVYEARDLQRNANVALKTLIRLDAGGIHAIKKEFRSLAGVSHPNLVRLHQLFSDAGRWYFTMELVEGEPFADWVRPGGHPDLWRLRAALVQLIRAVNFIHEAGKLHCDLKPSNVLCTSEGRVVVLDFGLVTALFGNAAQTMAGDFIRGTPAYMAPEQAAGKRALEASDFYAIGVMLFEALTGTLPFTGTTGEVLAAKQRDDPPSPGSFAAAPLPTDLEDLCMRLLARDPGDRPDRAFLERWADSVPGNTSASQSSPPFRPAAGLLGRGTELGLLRDAYRRSQHGQAVMVAVSGESGIGKSALTDSFIEELRAGGEAVVLAGRCYERESVPFKALDSMIDELSRYLRRLSPAQAAALLPRDAFALARLFPALGRVGVIADAPVREVSDPHEFQRRAFTGFGELLIRIRDRRPVVLHIDDLQWTDRDSVALLRYLLTYRVVAPLLVIVSYCSDDEQDALLQRVLSAARANRKWELRKLDLHPLPVAVTEQLAAQLLSRDANAQDMAMPSVIAGEAGGNPFFAIALARFAGQAGHSANVSLSLASVLASRVSSLPTRGRALLETVVLAGKPLPIEIALRASAATHEDLDALHEAQLVRSAEVSRGSVEYYHERIREYVCSSLSPEQARERYAGLGAELAQRPEPDHELLGRCLAGAGDLEGAARSAVFAAEHARSTLAFDRAAAFYQRALELGSELYGDDDRLALTVQLGEALENAGRGAEAAAVYLRAASLPGGSRDLELDLRRRAAQELLATGHVEEGTVLIRSVCSELGPKVPVSSSAAAAALLWSRLRLRLRGLEVSSAARTRSRAEVAWLQAAETAITGLARYSPLHAASVAGEYLLTALGAGDDTHLVSAFGFNAYLQSVIDPKHPSCRVMLDRMETIARREGLPKLMGFSALVKGAAAYHCHDFREAREHLREARKLLCECVGVGWHIDSTNLYDQLCAQSCGDFLDIARNTPVLIDEAVRRGRVWATAALSGFSGLPAWLVPDDPDGYLRQLEEIERHHWKMQAEPQWPDYMLLMGEAMTSIYAGRPWHGFELLTARHTAYQRSMFAKGPGSASVRYAMQLGACAVSSLRALPDRLPPNRAAWLHAARTAIATLRGHGDDASMGSALALQAALELDAGELARGCEALRGAVPLLQQSELRMLAAATKLRLGELVAGEEGAGLIGAATQVMRGQGVKNLDSMTELLCPGCRVV
jgi:eukaryotic-like serine/threonine-protein kinase